MRTLRCLWPAIAVLAVGCRAGPGPKPAPVGTEDATAAADVRWIVNAVLTRFPELPGVSVAVVQGGRPLLAEGFGWSDREAHAPMRADTGVYIASSTKAFVGLLCAQLAAEGVVQLDAPIVQSLPELDGWPDAHRITLRQLLTHSAGIANEPIVVRTAYTGEHSPEALIRLLRSSERLEPGFHYGNLGYVVAGLIVERATGRPWPVLLEERLFAPLGMAHTTASASRARRWPLATPHGLGTPAGARPIAFSKSDQTMHPAGGIVTDASDLLRWLEVNVRDGQLGGHPVLPAGVVQEAHREQVHFPALRFGALDRTGYGLGWYFARSHGRPLLHDFGAFAGWRAHVSFMPTAGIGVAVVANTSGPGAELVDLLADAIDARLLGEPHSEETLDASLASERARLDTLWGRIAAEQAKRRARAPTLAGPPSAYVGDYSNPQMGTLRIREDHGQLAASIGLLEASLEPGTQPETARVELIPETGELLHFERGAEGLTEGLRWEKRRFERVPSAPAP